MKPVQSVGKHVAGVKCGVYSAGNTRSFNKATIGVGFAPVLIETKRKNK